MTAKLVPLGPPRDDPLERDHGPYPAGAEWAEPDINHAAEILRWYSTIARRHALGERARRSIGRSTALHRRRRSCAIVSRRSERMRRAQHRKSSHCEAQPRSAAKRARSGSLQRARGGLGRTSGLGSAGAQARRAATSARSSPTWTRQAVLDGLRLVDHRSRGCRPGATLIGLCVEEQLWRRGIASFGCRRSDSTQRTQGNRRCARQPHQARPTTPRSARPQRSVAPAGTRTRTAAKS